MRRFVASLALECIIVWCLFGASLFVQRRVPLKTQFSISEECSSKKWENRKCHLDLLDNYDQILVRVQ